MHLVYLQQQKPSCIQENVTTTTKTPHYKGSWWILKNIERLSLSHIPIEKQLIKILTHTIKSEKQEIRDTEVPAQ